MQVPGDGADPPFFYMVIAQYLRLQFSGNGHGHILFDVDRFERPDDEARILDEQTAGSYGRTCGTAMLIAVDRHRKCLCLLALDRRALSTPNHSRAAVA